MCTTEVQEGLLDFDAPAAGKQCKTWFKIVGDLSCGITPLLVLHGGPGLTHDYVLPMADLNERFGIPVIFYDQIGNGLSTHLPEKLGDESFWTEALFHAELSNLVDKLCLSNFDILGHSWGGMMVSTWAASRPQGLRKLVLSNVAATIKVWDDVYSGYRQKLPQRVQDLIAKHEESGTVEAPQYQEVMGMFNRRHFCKIIPTPAEFQKSLNWKAEDMTVSLTMHGPSKWLVTGSLNNWTAIPSLKQIANPTLVINGKNEGANDFAIAPLLQNIPDVTWIKLYNSTHMPHFEDRDNYLHVVGSWLSFGGYVPFTKRASKL